MKYHWPYIFLIPFTALNVLASLLLAIPYGITAWRWHAGCLELVAKRTRHGKTRIWGRPGAQCLGCNVIWYASKIQWDRSDLRVHERCHVIQGTLGLGIPFGVAYGLSFFWHWYRSGFGDWQRAYYRIWAERQAYEAQGEYLLGERAGAWGSVEP